MRSLQIETIAQLIGWRGVIDILRWAEGKFLVHESLDSRTSLPSLDVFEIHDGRLVMKRTLAKVTDTFEIVVAGSLVPPDDRTDGVSFVVKCKDLETALRVYWHYRGKRTESGTLIMSTLPEDGWYDNNDPFKKD